MHVHFDALILTTFFVGGFEGAAVGWASKSEELVEAVTEAFEGAVCAINRSVTPASFRSVTICSANDRLGNFNDAVKDVADCATQLASGGVVRPRR